MNPQQNIQQRSSTKHNKIFITITISFILMILSIGAGTVIYLGKLLNTDTFYDGITIDGLPIKGLTKESAEKILEQKNQPRLDNLNIKLIYNSKSWQFRYSDMSASLDIKEKINQAYNIAREGNVFQRYLTMTKLERQGYSINTELRYNVDSLRGSIEKIAMEINKAPVNASIYFKPDDNIKFRITPEKEGTSLNTEKVLDEIKEILKEGMEENTIDLVPDKVQPNVFAGEFTGKTEKIVTFGTDLSKSAEGRTNNVVKAASAFNGMVVMPGQIVSFNRTTGERTLKKGYGYAPMIQNNHLVDVPGGGVSQTSSTLYNAVIRAGLEVLEWTRHSFPSSYIDKGLDTTVNLPSPEIDLKFRNNKNSPIYIRTFYANKKIYFEIYGEPLPNGREYKFYSEVYETIPATTPDIIRDLEGKYAQYEDERHVMVGSREGYKVRVYRQIFENGNFIKEELFDSHFYKPVKGLIHEGVKKRPPDSQAASLKMVR